MTERQEDIRKTFTLAEANAALPLVRAIVEDLAVLSREVGERRRRVAELLSERGRETREPYREELAQMERDLEHDTHRLRELAEELRDLGVEPKSPTSGLVDFPAMVDGRLVNLCWKLGEPEVLFWHERDEGFRDRRPVTERPGQPTRPDGG